MSSKTDLTYEITYNPRFVPQRFPKVKIRTLLVEGRKTYVLKNSLTGMYYDVDEVSNGIWNLIDGQRTITQINEEITKKWSDIEPNTTMEVIMFLAEAGCLKSAVERAPKKRVRIPSAFEVDVTLVERSKSFLEGIHKIFRPLLRAPLFWGSVAFILICSIVFAGQFTAIFADASSFRVLGSTVVGFFFYSFIVLGPTIAIHEIAHGLALVHYGGTPGEIGTGLFYFGPMFYIDATDSWTLSRRQRIMVMMAGNISTLLIASAIVAVGYVFSYPASVSHLLYMTAFFCFYATLMNLAPPFETDGYYVLADLVNVPNLRQESYGYVKSLFKKALGVRTEKADYSTKKRRILVGFAFLSVAWIFYTAFQTTLFTFYMAEDANVAFLTVSSAIISSEALTLAAVMVSIASVLYFGMTLTGYGVILLSAVRKAFRVPLKFESIHDRDLSMFFYVPSKDSLVVKRFHSRVEGIAKKFTQSFEVRQVGPVFTAKLRMGGTKLALSQIGAHLRMVEQSFSSMYQDFLKENNEEILQSTGTHPSTMAPLEALLAKMGNEIAEARTLEAKIAVKETIERQKKAAMYLLNSAFGSIWTIELPHSLLNEIVETLYPSLMVEDFAITDLYGETEEFKKCTIYGYDTLSKLSAQNRMYLKEAIRKQGEYQVVSCFEPIKSRFLFVGRTEQIERDIHMFGTLFIGQAWSGYMDNLLSQTNLTLSTLLQAPALSNDDIDAMADGEIFVLKENLSALSACEKAVNHALEESEEFTDIVMNNVQGFKEYFEKTELLKGSLMDAIIAINMENLSKIPRRLGKFTEEFQMIMASIGELAERMQKEHKERERRAKKKRIRVLHLYPLVTVLSALLVLIGIFVGNEMLDVSFLVTAAFLHAMYWVSYWSRWRSSQRAGRYSSPSFMSTQFFSLAFAEAIYKFIATYSVIAPMKKNAREQESKKA